MAQSSKKRSTSTNGGGGRSPVAMAIGGHEERTGEMLILRKFAELLPSKRVVVATLASAVADETWADYRRAFSELGLEPVHLKMDRRIDAIADPPLHLLENAGGIFFTGGDQIAITTKISGTGLSKRIFEMYKSGTVIAGTSAGASVLSETMVVAGNAEESHKLGNALLLAPGLGFLRGVVIDQHFAQRGRISRLIGIIGQNPHSLGVGIDENTAIIVHDGRFDVIGAGAVYVIDGHPVTYTNLSEEDRDRTMSVFDLRLHVLSQGDCFLLDERKPAPGFAASEEGNEKAAGAEKAGKS
jgi:cyanophycinase